MTTLVLSPFFYPELISTGRYNTVLVEGLAARGEAVTVFASHPLYPRWQPERSEAQLPGVVIERGGHWLRYPKSALLRRLVLETWFAFFVCRRYLALKARPRHVVPIFPPSLFHCCLRPLLPRDTKVTGIVHDLQGVLAASTVSGAARLLKKPIAWLEGRSFANCDRLVFLSRSMAERAIEQYGLDRQRCVVRYPFLTLRPNGSGSGNALETLLPLEHINVVYSGALGDKQSPDELLAFLSRQAQRNARIVCHIFSAGPHFERLQRATRTGDQRIRFHPLVAEEHLDELYARSTLQLIPQLDGTADASLPSKLPNLIAAGVPVFAICDPRSEVNSLLTASAAGISAASFTASDIDARFDALLATIDAEPRETRRQRQTRFVEENFSVERVVDAILET